MPVITQTVTIYGFVCEACGYGLIPTLPKCRAETHCYLESPSYCGRCGAKLEGNIQLHNTDKEKSLS